MKALEEQRLEAIRLRIQGMSYREIKERVPVSKSSLSLWLKSYPLPTDQIPLIKNREYRRIEHFRETMRLKREAAMQKVYTQQKEKVLPLTNRELLVGGLFLYWGEGAKTRPSETCLSNTDPRIVRFFRYWLTDILNIPTDRIRGRLHIYSDMNVDKETEFWSETLDLPANQFYRPYIKKSQLSDVTFRTFHHGTCNISVGSKDLTSVILMSIQAIADEYTVPKEDPGPWRNG